MRILHTSDWHLGKNLEGHSRMEEQELFLKDFINIVQENHVDLIIIAGDIYDSGNPPAKAEKIFYHTLKELSSEGNRLILIIAGNHDNPDRLVAAEPLAKEHGIIMIGTPKFVVSKGTYGNNKVINSGKGFIEIEIKGEKAIIITVPYPSEKRLNELLYENMEDEKEKAKSYNDKIKKLFYHLSKNYREDTINILVSHLFTLGSVQAGSERNLELGGSLIVDADCFPENAQYIALGHIHKPQIVPGTNGRVRYSGSPIQYNKKEINFKKKCFIVDVKPRENCHIEEIEFKTYKPIEIWKCTNIQDAMEKCTKNKNKNCWVYMEVTTDRFIREDEIKFMKTTKKDILEIVPKIKNTFLENIDVYDFSRKSFKEIFREFYLKERKVEPQPELIDLLLSIIKEGKEDETY